MTKSTGTLGVWRIVTKSTGTLGVWRIMTKSTGTLEVWRDYDHNIQVQAIKLGLNILFQWAKVIKKHTNANT